MSTTAFKLSSILYNPRTSTSENSNLLNEIPLTRDSILRHVSGASADQMFSHLVVVTLHATVSDPGKIVTEARSGNSATFSSKLFSANAAAAAAKQVLVTRCCRSCCCCCCCCCLRFQLMMYCKIRKLRFGSSRTAQKKWNSYIRRQI